MGQFSTEIYYPPGSTLNGNQHFNLSEINEAVAAQARGECIKAVLIP